MREAGDERDRGQYRQAVAEEREILRAQLFEWLDPVMTALGLVTLVLLLVDFAGVLTARETTWVRHAEQAIWALFALDFAVQFALAPDKRRYLRTHWLVALSVALPAFRVVRALRALWALRSVHLLGLLGGTNRAMRVLRQMLRGRRLGYLLALTALVIAVGTVGVYVSERGQQGADILTLGDALWWASCLVTTINNELYPVSIEGRILGFLLRIYAVGVFGLLAASLASYLVGQQQEQQDQGDGAARDALAEEVRRLREEVQALRLQQAAPAAARPAPPPEES